MLRCGSLQSTRIDDGLTTFSDLADVKYEGHEHSIANGGRLTIFNLADFFAGVKSEGHEHKHTENSIDEDYSVDHSMEEYHSIGLNSIDEITNISDYKLLVEFVEYIRFAFFEPDGSQFHWMKDLKESSVKTLDKIPLAEVDIPAKVYETSTNMLNRCSAEALASFVSRTLKIFRSDLTLSAEESIKSHVDMFWALAMVLRCKPGVFISAWPTLNVKENTEYSVQDGILVLAWVLSEVSQRDYIYGMYMWVRYLFPLLINESNLSRESIDMIFQLMDRILSSYAKCRVDDRSVRNGERVVPPSTLVLMGRIAFSANSTRGEVSEMLRRRFSTFRCMALVCSCESEAAKQISEQLIPYVLEGSYLGEEAMYMFVWCLVHNPGGSFKQWDNIYLENLAGSIVMLRLLSDDWVEKVLPQNYSLLGPLMKTMKSIVLKSEEALASEHDTARQATLKEAQKHAKIILGPLIALDWQNLDL